MEEVKASGMETFKQKGHQREPRGEGQAGPRPRKIPFPPFSPGLCKEGKFYHPGGLQIGGSRAKSGSQMYFVCVVSNQFKSTFHKVGIVHVQILGFWFFLEPPGSSGLAPLCSRGASFGGAWAEQTHIS